MRKFGILTILLAALLTVFFCCAEEDGGLLFNPDFEITDEDGNPEGWYTENYYFGASEFELLQDETGNHYVRVTTAEEDDARYVQWVDAKPDTLYEISCRVRIDEPIVNGRGANLSALNSLNAYSPSVFDTHGEWQPLTFYGRTGEDQTGFYLALRVGGYSSTSTGTAYFDDVSITPVSGTDGVAEVSLTTFPAVSEAEPDDEDDGPAQPVRHTETWLLLSAGALLLSLLFITRTENGQFRREKLLFAILMAAAFAVRVAAACFVRGYDVDITDFELWGERMAAQGFSFYGDGSYFCDYPPLYMLLLGIAGGLKNLLGIGFDSFAHQLIVKLVPIFCDLAAAFLAYRVAKKRHGGALPMIVAVLVALNPAFLVDSAAWGQIDSVFTVLIACSVLLLDDEKPIAALVLFALSVLIKPQPLLFAPLGLALLIAKVLHRKELWKEAVFGVFAALLTLYLVALPFAVMSARALGERFSLLTPVSWLIRLYTGTVSGYRCITVNALNFYNIFGLNWTDIEAVPKWAAFGWTMFGIAYAFSCASVLLTKRKRSGCLAGAALMALIFAFAPMMHERYLFPAILLLFLAYAESGDRRVLYAAVLFSATQTVNMVLVLQSGTVREFASMGHLQSSEQTVNMAVSVLNVLLALYTSWLCVDILLLRHTVLTPIPLRKNAGLSLEKPVTWRERAAVAVITLIYAGFALFNVGSFTAPQSEWTPYDGDSAVFDLNEVRSFSMNYYAGYALSGFTVEFSKDGETWSHPENALCNQGEVFRWNRFVPVDENLKNITAGSEKALDETGLVVYPSRTSDDYPLQTARYVRLTAAGSETVLGEIAFFSEDGTLLPVSCDVPELTDEQDIAVLTPSWYNSTYFDEIYHVRTAYEHLHSLNAYEWTHPPLGKVLIMFGIRLFGMTPFGWRFSGTMAGVFMLPVLYAMIRVLTRRRDLSFVGMLLLTLDSMHYTQSRLATVDSFAVLFIMTMYLFMFIYMNRADSEKPLVQKLIPLALSGIFMGCACSAKWIGLYAAVGLCMLFAVSLLSRAFAREEKSAFRETGLLAAAALFALLALYAGACLVLTKHGKPVTPIFPGSVNRMLTLLPESVDIALAVLSVLGCAAAVILLGKLSKRASFEYEVAVTGVTCVVFFIVVPLITYYYSYTWQLACEGGVTMKRVVELQNSMFSYHAGLGSDTHYFRSPWYEWPLIVRPMWYYSASPALLNEDMVSSISCMGNPAVWWTGCAATVYSLFRLCTTKKPEKPRLFAVIGFLSQFLPWVLVPRSTFIYHYFASVPFIIVLTVLALKDLSEIDLTVYQAAICVLVGISLVLFVMFYPLESGVSAPYGYMLHLRWFKWYNFALK